MKRRVEGFRQEGACPGNYRGHQQDANREHQTPRADRLRRRHGILENAEAYTPLLLLDRVGQLHVLGTPQARLIELLRGRQIAGNPLKLLLHDGGAVDTRLKLCKLRPEPTFFLAKDLQLGFRVGDRSLEPLGIRIHRERRWCNTRDRSRGADSRRRCDGRLLGRSLFHRELSFQRGELGPLLYHVRIAFRVA